MRTNAVLGLAVALGAAVSCADGAPAAHHRPLRVSPAFLAPTPAWGQGTAQASGAERRLGRHSPALGLREGPPRRAVSAACGAVASSGAGGGLLEQIRGAVLPAATALAILVGAPVDAPAELTAEQKIVAQAWTTVDATYVDRTFNNQDWFKLRQKLVKRSYASKEEAYTAISDEMLAPLGDVYTRFINPSKYEALKNSIVSGGKGQDVSGIGVTLSIDKDSKLVKIVDVVEGSPAEKGGLKRNSLFLEVNGVKTEAGQSSAEEVAAMVRGPTGTEVKVKVQEEGQSKDLNLQRQQVNIKPVKGGVAGKTGWIKIKQFDQQTADLVKTQLEENKAAGSSCNVIDLRDNAGGFFRAGVDVASLFLPAGKQEVFVINKNGVADSFTTDKDGIDTTTPTYLLVNGNTASASEILTGALKDNGRATVVGERTFGKGVVQTVSPLADGSGVAVTIARYETPNKIDINKKGIQVDTADTSKMCPDPYPGL